MVVLALPAAAADRAVNIRAIEGVYRVPMKFPDNGIAPDLTEDRLELKRCTDGSVYFFTELGFAADHQCSLSGIARSDNGSLVYREGECTLRIVPDGKWIVFKDPNGSCTTHCSARGHFDSVGFSMSSKHEATDADRKRMAERDGETWKQCNARR